MTTLHTVFITGAAGYVGGMLTELYAQRDDVARVIALDREPRPESLARGAQENDKIIWITANTADRDTWYDAVAALKPDIVIHTAWQIRELYGRQEVEWRWNVEGSRAIFEFAYETGSVERLVYFSTAAVYGAYASNTLEHRFREEEPMREEEYSYAREKIAAERALREVDATARERGTHRPVVSVVRPAAITGPRGRFARVRFGLQSALAGKLSGSFFYRIVSLMVSYVPATPWWVRQFIHEDDVADIVSLLAFDARVDHDLEVFNIAPPGEPVYARQLAASVGKGVLMLHPLMVRLAFFIFWHLSRGKIPNGRGVWRFYSYPLLLDGTKLTEHYDYEYRHTSGDAFMKTTGRYEHVVPEGEQKH